MKDGGGCQGECYHFGRYLVLTLSKVSMRFRDKFAEALKFFSEAFNLRAYAQVDSWMLYYRMLIFSNFIHVKYFL